MPCQSYTSPWSVASPKHAVFIRRQGCLNKSFVHTVVDAMETSLEHTENSDYVSVDDVCMLLLSHRANRRAEHQDTDFDDAMATVGNR